MRYAPIAADLFTENRRRLRELLPPGALAIFQANDVLPTNADGHLAFRQNNDLFSSPAWTRRKASWSFSPMRGWKSSGRFCF